MNEFVRSTPVLDHGYVTLIESWGSDERVIESARMSTGKGFLGWGGECDHGQCTCYGLDTEQVHCAACESMQHCEKCGGSGYFVGDEKLLRYLYEHKHQTPFEMAGMTIEVQAPIFVFREWHRHRAQSYNEMSARYTKMPDLHYVPSVERLLSGGQDSKNRQGSVNLQLQPDEAEEIRAKISCLQANVYQQYNELLELGIAKELARINTPVSRYSRMRASANLRNWLAFLTLRMDPAAQFEIREYANAVGRLIQELFPRTWELFAEGRS